MGAIGESLAASFSTRKSRLLTVAVLAACAASAVAAGFVGISDNPPGVLLAFLAAIAFVLAFAHPWRTTRQFKVLFYASVLGLLIFAVLHNVFEALAHLAAAVPVIAALLQALGVVSFLLAILLCPPAALVGGAGAVVMLVRNRPRR